MIVAVTRAGFCEKAASVVDDRDVVAVDAISEAVGDDLHDVHVECSFQDADWFAFVLKADGDVDSEYLS